MSDDEYAPSTDEVRERFSLAQCGGTYGPREMRPAVKYRKRFDRWLAAHDAERETALRERIAQDIETEGYRHEEECPEGSCEECDLVYTLANIARGEG